MDTVFRLSRSVTRLLARGMLVAFLVSQFAWADHFHLDLEQNAGCAVCAFVDNSPALPAIDTVQPLDAVHSDCPTHRPADNPLSPPSFNHHSRAPPTR